MSPYRRNASARSRAGPGCRSRLRVLGSARSRGWVRGPERPQRSCAHRARLAFLVGGTYSQVCLFREINKLYGYYSFYRYDGFTEPGPSLWNVCSRTLELYCQHMNVCSALVVFCWNHVEWPGLIFLSTIAFFFFLVINKIRRKPIRSCQIQVHKANHII